MNTSNRHKNSDIDNQKLRQNLRQEVRSRRKNLTTPQQLQAAQKLKDKLSTHPKIQQADHIAAFLSVDGEIDTTPLIASLWQQGKSVYLPVIHPFTPGHLLFIRYTPTTIMTQGAFGIKSPKLDVRQVIPFNQLDVVLTPLVAFDKNGYRLGMGGGYYDRMLTGYHHSNINPIGVAHHCQEIPHVPSQHWDIALPEIITDRDEFRPLIIE